MNKSRYLDVMTVNASRGSTLSKDNHQLLFVEPVILPNMSHLKVDKPTEASDSCLFYPSGQKSVQMKSEIDKAVRNITSEVAIMETIMQAKKPLKTMRESIIVPNRATSPKPSASTTSTKSISPARASTSSKAYVSSKTLIFPAGDTAGYDPRAPKPEMSDPKKEPLFQGKKTSKEMKELLRKVRQNESSIVSTVKSRF